MFTGIITDIGEVAEMTRAGNDARLVIRAAAHIASAPTGASVACGGICLSVVAHEAEAFVVEATPETLSCTTMEDWGPGTRINLERALRAGDEIGGHFVSGHVDGVCVIEALETQGASQKATFRAPLPLARLIAPKGSVALDGVSLTVNEVDGASFGVQLIPHTLETTTFGAAETGGRVNLETDMLARTMARLTEADRHKTKKAAAQAREA